jgi:RNA polymerase sigma factor (TIGR02999 family)
MREGSVSPSGEAAVGAPCPAASGSEVRAESIGGASASHLTQSAATELTAAEGSLTQLLQSWQAGEGSAVADVFAVAYEELKRIASQRLHLSGRDLTLTPTELVHDVYLRIAPGASDYVSRAHFYASMSLHIRSALVDHARARSAAKRPPPALRVSLANVDPGEESTVADLLSLDQALRRLEALDRRCSEALHLTYFAGLDRQQISGVLKVSLASVDRDLRFARAWLAAELAHGS